MVLLQGIICTVYCKQQQRQHYYSISIFSYYCSDYTLTAMTLELCMLTTSNVLRNAWFSPPINLMKPGIQWVQSLADILHSVLCYHSNETHASITNPSNSAQLGEPHTIPQLTSGSMQQHRKAVRDRQTHRRPWLIYISNQLHLTRNLTNKKLDITTTKI